MKLLLLALIPFTVSCGNIRPTLNTQPQNVVVSSSLQSPTPISHSSQEKAIRSIDFRNFTYQWTPKWDTPPKIGSIVLKDGNMDASVLPNGRIGTLGFSLVDVTYGDLTGDNLEEAVVTLAIDSGGNSMPQVVFTYTLRNNKAKMLWVHETGDRAEDGIRNLYIDNGTLVIEQYNLEKIVVNGDEIPTTGLCCPKTFTRSYYKWNGRNFDKAKSQIARNEFGNAKILLGNQH
jgi:hypothetical protein